MMYTMTFIMLVAGILSGETINNNEQAYVASACTVRNRLDAGWGTGTVMSKLQYKAPWVEPTEEEVEIVKRVLHGEIECGDEYFILSLQDTMYLFSAFDYLSKHCETEHKCNLYLSIEQYRNAERR